MCRTVGIRIQNPSRRRFLEGFRQAHDPSWSRTFNDILIQEWFQSVQVMEAASIKEVVVTQAQERDREIERQSLRQTRRQTDGRTDRDKQQKGSNMPTWHPRWTLDLRLFAQHRPKHERWQPFKPSEEQTQSSATSYLSNVLGGLRS